MWWEIPICVGRISRSQIGNRKEGKKVGSNSTEKGVPNIVKIGKANGELEDPECHRELKRFEKRGSVQL